MRVGIHELQAAVNAAKHIEREIKQKYPAYKGWLVLSTRYGQADASASIEEILKIFPDIMLAGPGKAKYQALRVAIEQQDALAHTIRDPVRQVQQAVAKASLEQSRQRLLAELELDPTVQIEIRFKELKYEAVVWPLQQDELVDRQRTPQTRASIQIVVGTIGELCHGS